MEKKGGAVGKSGGEGCMGRMMEPTGWKGGGRRRRKQKLGWGLSFTYFEKYGKRVDKVR